MKKFKNKVIAGALAATMALAAVPATAVMASAEVAEPNAIVATVAAPEVCAASTLKLVESKVPSANPISVVFKTAISIVKSIMASFGAILAGLYIIGKFLSGKGSQD